jgi:uncharacterized membrane protein
VTDQTSPDSASTTAWQRFVRWFHPTSADSITIDRPPEVVWKVYSDIASWPEWTQSVTSAALDPEGPLAIGSRASIKQPRLPRVEWTVTALRPDRSWMWESKAPGATTVATHVLTPLDDGRTQVELSIDQRGVIGRPIGWLVRRLTRRYLRYEAEGLRRRSESTPNDDAAEAT